MRRQSCILVAIILASALMVHVPVSASPGKTVNFDQPNYVFDTHNATVGTRFNVTVLAASDSYPWKLQMWQVYLPYNESMVNVTQIWGDVTNDWTYRAWPNDNFDGRTWDNDYVFKGKSGGAIGNPAYISSSLTGGNAAVMLGDLLGSAVNVSGPKKLCTIEFEIVAVPPAGSNYTCNLAIANDDTYVFDNNGKIVDATIQSGSYLFVGSSAPPSNTFTVNAHDNTEGNDVSVSLVVDGSPGYSTPYTFTSATVTHTFAVPSADSSGHSFKQWSTGETTLSITVNSAGTYTAYYEQTVTPGQTRIYVDPPEINDPTMLPSSMFDINVTVENVTSLLICQFNLTYNPSILQWMGIRIFKVLGQVPTASLEVNDEGGYMWLKLTYPTPITTIPSTALARITFSVEAMGVSVLGLEDTLLLDGNHNPIPHKTENGLFIGLIRDVAVTNLLLSRTWAYKGWNVDVTLTVKNLGNVSETFNVTAYYDSKPIGNVTVSNLPPNVEENVTIPWNTSDVGAGVYTIKGEASLVPFEFNTANNVFVGGTVTIIVVKHDVAIVNVTTSATWAYQGRTVEVDITVKNVGDVNETFNVTSLYDGNTLAVYQLNNLPANATVVLVSMWNTTLVPAFHNYTISAQASQLPYEFNTTNNNYTDGTVEVRIVGDVNDDGKVDMVDLWIVQQAFGSIPGAPRWNEYADLDGNLKVDMRDIWIVGGNFGAHSP